MRPNRGNVRPRGADDAPGDVGWARANARPRIADGDRGIHNIMGIGDLGDALAHVVGYLAPPSRALLAVAVTAPPPSWFSAPLPRQPNEMGRAILSANGSWEVLDYEEIEKDLASRLTDVDIAASLVCIDALNCLEKLKLAGCVSISGAGLQPLLDSTGLVQIDLSLVGQHQSPTIQPLPALSEAEVLPVLRSIVRSTNPSLKHLQLPEKWRKNPNEQLSAFLREYDALLSSRRSICKVCERGIVVPDGDSWVIHSEEFHPSFYGMQSFTCGVCTENICDACEVDGGHSFVEQCDTCRRDYCRDCNGMNQCWRCMNYTCEGCADACKCCNTFDCHKCLSVGVPEAARLRDTAQRCTDCNEAYCFDHRWEVCRRDMRTACPGCLVLIVPAIDEMNGHGYL